MTIPGPTRAERVRKLYASHLDAGSFAEAAAFAKELAWMHEVADDEDGATLWHCNAEAAQERALERDPVVVHGRRAV